MTTKLLRDLHEKAFLRRPFIRAFSERTDKQKEDDDTFLESYLRARVAFTQAEFPLLGDTLVHTNRLRVVKSLRKVETRAVQAGIHNVDALARTGGEGDSLYKGPLVMTRWRRDVPIWSPVLGMDGVMHPLRSNEIGYFLPGCVYQYGQPPRVLTSEEYVKLLPSLRPFLGDPKYSTSQMMYVYMAWDESLAPEWDKAPAVMEKFHNALRLVPQVTLACAIPARVRYFGFSKNTQRGVIREILEPYTQGDGKSTLLFDEIAWVTIPEINGKPVNGRAIFTEDLRFVVSEWCFREGPWQGDGTEMYHGNDNRHTLTSWCAGPLLNRFGGRQDMVSLRDLIPNERKLAHNLIKSLLPEFQLVSAGAFDPSKIKFPALLHASANNHLYLGTKPRNSGFHCTEVFYPSGHSEKITGYEKLPGYGFIVSNAWGEIRVIPEELANLIVGKENMESLRAWYAAEEKKQEEKKAAVIRAQEEALRKVKTVTDPVQVALQSLEEVK